MKIYKLKGGILAEENGNFHHLKEADWDSFINDDHILSNTRKKLHEANRIQDPRDLLSSMLEAPVQSQEIWASGVTYFNSKLGREEESRETGGSNFYARVYEAHRPELFFKAMGYRVVPHGGKVRKRADSTWDVPEPELTLVITSGRRIIGYTIGNDMSSRSIEGENPLYLPQAKCYDGSTALGPCILLREEPLPLTTQIHLTILRHGEEVFGGKVGIDQIKRKFEDLVDFLYLENSFPKGSLLMTGTGIVPSPGFNLGSGDVIRIAIDGIGELVNTVA